MNKEGTEPSSSHNRLSARIGLHIKHKSSTWMTPGVHVLSF